MALLWLVSFFWAFSFGLVKHLHGFDAAFLSAARLSLALLLFLPFLRPGRIPASGRGRLLLTGAIQFGLMYLAYNESFRHLPSYAVALLTLTTPIFVTLLADAADGRFHGRALGAALLSVAAGLCLVLPDGGFRASATGAALVQVSNLAFAAGQVGYRRWRRAHPEIPAREVFGLLYLGAVALTVPVCLLRTDFAGLRPALTAPNLGILLYLGLVASGAGFFLWNLGASRVAAGPLAAMNNVKIPLGVACSLLAFGEHAPAARLAASGAVMAGALWLARSGPPAALPAGGPRPATS